MEDPGKETYYRCNNSSKAQQLDNGEAQIRHGEGSTYDRFNQSNYCNYVVKNEGCFSFWLLAENVIFGRPIFFNAAEGEKLLKKWAPRQKSLYREQKQNQTQYETKKPGNEIRLTRTRATLLTWK